MMECIRNALMKISKEEEGDKDTEGYRRYRQTLSQKLERGREEQRLLKLMYL